jgi:hypothetical protein
LDSTQGGRNRVGGAQMFWDLDTPTGNEDNAYQNRRVFGWMSPGLGGIWPFVNLDSFEFVQPIVNIWPNPVSDILNIKDYAGTVTIYSVMGNQVLKIENFTGSVDVSQLANGVYIIATKKGMAKILKE